MSKITKVSVKLQDLGRVIDELYFTSEPSKEQIKKEIERKLNVKLEVKNYEPEEGGDFGAFFYLGNIYITYSFSEIDLIKVKEH